MIDNSLAQFLIGMIAVSGFVLVLSMAYSLCQKNKADCESKCKSGGKCCGSGNCSTKEEAPKQEEKGYTGTDC